jgi:hypothetical protein
MQCRVFVTSGKSGWLATMIKSPKSLSFLFLAFGLVYALSFWVMVTVDADSAESRFVALNESGAYARSIGHGEQTLSLRMKDGIDPEELVSLKYALADAHRRKGKPARAAQLFREVLASDQATRMSLLERTDIKEKIAQIELVQGNIPAAAEIYAAFLEAAGDAVARSHHKDIREVRVRYLERIDNAQVLFTEGLPPIHDREILEGPERERLDAARNMAALGGYYSLQERGDYAAAGLLSAAYVTRMEILGPADKDTLHTALILGPIYQKLGRTKDAEALYLSAFHAQERSKGSNSPELSLYIRLLAEVYKEQARYTEAEALNIHIQRLFKDAFGARRYLSSQSRDRRADINRPVSADFPLKEADIPTDLVEAARFDIPLSKPADIDEMKIRLAEELGEDSDFAMPQQLDALLTLCQEQSGDRLSLRSGYRSYQTQKVLFDRNGNRGTVTLPGTSEHQTGLAVDVDVNRRFMRETDRAYQCFEENAWRYGFILSYPKGNTYLPGPDTFEPWHWRYVGTRTALLYREAGPVNKPQEFLAALPCYEERTQAGIWSIADEKDVCLESVSVNLSKVNTNSSENNSVVQ